LRHADQSDDRIFRLYVSLFLLDLMAGHGQVVNGNQRRSVPAARAAPGGMFADSIGLIWD
jgi:hypothetical protein